MTIAINATSAKMGGALTYLLNLLPALDRDNRHIYIVAVSDAIELPPVHGIRIHCVPASICSSPLKLFFWQQTALPALLRQAHCDLLFSTANFGTLFCPCPQILLIRIPHFFSDHYLTTVLSHKSLVEKIDFALRRLLIMLSARAATHVMLPTRAMRDGFGRHCFDISAKSRVNHYGVPINTFERCVRDRKPSSRIRIVCTSHYSDYKNYTTIFRALVELKKHAIDYQFTAPINLELPLFKKASSHNQDRALITQLGQSLNLLGPVPYSALPDLYTDADMFVWPSLSESFGHPLIEAMAAELPIICSDIPVNRELCGDAALYVPPLDSTAWARTIRELADDTQLQRHLVDRGTKRLQNFHWSDHVDRLIQLFDDAQNQRSHSG